MTIAEAIGANAKAAAAETDAPTVGAVAAEEEPPAEANGGTRKVEMVLNEVAQSSEGHSADRIPDRHLLGFPLLGPTGNPFPV